MSGVVSAGRRSPVSPGGTRADARGLVLCHLAQAELPLALAAGVPVEGRSKADVRII